MIEKENVWVIAGAVCWNLLSALWRQMETGLTVCHGGGERNSEGEERQHLHPDNWGHHSLSHLAIADNVAVVAESCDDRTMLSLWCYSRLTVGTQMMKNQQQRVAQG